MSAEERRALTALQERHDDFSDCGMFDGDDGFGASMLDGSEPIEISHAGGELQELTRKLVGDFWNTNTARSRVRRTDYRTRRDRTRRRTEAFDKQMLALTCAYLDWHMGKGTSDGRGFFFHYRDDSHRTLDVNAGTIPVQVVDVFYAERLPLTILSTDAFIASALVRQGVVPCSPISPSTGVTMEALNLFRIARQRNPHFSIQAYVKTLCDLQGMSTQILAPLVQFYPYLSRQFSIALDVFLQILASVDALVLEAIGHSNPNWRPMHACPACTYTLKGETALKFRLLYTMDGNDSLKRVLKKLVRDDSDHFDNNNNIPLPQSAELPSTQHVRGDRYLTRDYVDHFAGDSAVDMLSGDEVSSIDLDNPCAARWNNMKDEKTRRMWGVFDESGIFMAVCRHGFSLVIADMVQSGEQSKYPLAVVSKLLDVFGKDLGGGYDIGCRFKTTLSRSALGPSARELNHTSLVGAFHGHAHKRLCQLDHLTMYVEGLGLEDLEGCERTFSKSNALASSVRYSSIFHRHQAITNYFQHTDDFEVYANISTFLHNNYKQALNILLDGRTTLPQLMCELGLADDSVFNRWLAEERNYLMSLNHEPKHETLQMEYWQKLVNLAASRKDLDAASTPWSISTPSTASFGSRDIATTIRNKTARCHAIENYDKDLKVVQELEVKLGVVRRWTPDDPEWMDAGRLVANRKFQRALDALEGLVVARIFELSKMNRAGTGYKLRKHIGKALQARSAAIRTALDRYNTAARALSPPRPTISWDEVVEYAFLSDFDLLRDARQDISQRTWATPTGRLAMDTYFKMQRAQEEIQRLNIEIKRMVTYLRDKDIYLRNCEKQLQSLHPALAHQVGVYRNIRARFTKHHLHHLHTISKLPGFTGSLSPGDSTEDSPGASASTPAVYIPAQLVVPVHPVVPDGVEDGIEDLEDEEGADADVEEQSRILEDIFQVTLDT
ncbi:hypothetical protein DEU56DRAFT_737641 [Suillus clintonianus]|uniref:uncharacterized protein n=1 Tax=Suillus clintonianus TaxID=1904413 RepID=UPI001B87FE3E|nr:uncharacterized protein DEU56DRAFT_737641 [Suillus clintonianus]KAG2135775.1 hypothetical protein DEU56DRAFT_737641 [Suillus clintonianus]